MQTHISFEQVASGNVTDKLKECSSLSVSKCISKLLLCSFSVFIVNILMVLLKLSEVFSTNDTSKKKEES